MPKLPAMSVGKIISDREMELSAESKLGPDMSMFSGHICNLQCKLYSVVTCHIELFLLSFHPIFHFIPSLFLPSLLFLSLLSFALYTYVHHNFYGVAHIANPQAHTGKLI